MIIAKVYCIAINIIIPYTVLYNYVNWNSSVYILLIDALKTLVTIYFFSEVDTSNIPILRII